MAVVRSLITDALMEIGVVQASETPEAADAQLALRYFQRQLDAWQADRLTLSTQLRTAFTLLPGTSSVTIGVGGFVPIVRPVFFNAVNYVIPGSSPEVEVPIAIMDEDSYSSLSIKELPSNLPMQCFWNTRADGVLGDLFFWPQVQQSVEIAIYTPQAIGVPASLNTVLLSPPGYEQAFVYELALRLCGPFGVAPRGDLQDLAQKAIATMKRQNVAPGLLGIDAALVPTGGGYNIFSDVTNASSGR